MSTNKKRKTGVDRVWVQALLILAAAVVLWLISLVNGQKALSYEADVQVRYQGEGVPAEIVETMRSDGRRKAEAAEKTTAGLFPETAAWNVEYRVEAANPALSFKQDVTCILVEGDKSQVVKDRLVAGGYGYADDDEGCVISSKAAWKLFGSTAVVGQWITVKGKRYIIRGVTADTNSVVILSSGRMKPDFFRNVSFSYGGAGSHAGETEELMVRYGFPRGEVMVDGSLFGAVVRLCRILPLPAILLAVWPLLGQMAGGEGQMHLKKRRLILYGVRAALTAAAVILIVGAVRIPEDLLPTKWSDFDFYVQKFQAIQEHLLRLDMLSLSEWDVEVKRAFAASVLFSAEAALFIVTAILPIEKAALQMKTTAFSGAGTVVPDAASLPAAADSSSPQTPSNVSVDAAVPFQEPEAE